MCLLDRSGRACVLMSCSWGVKSRVDSFTCEQSNPKLTVILRASCGAVYCNCNRSCLFVGVVVCLWVCYHDNSKLHASILTKLGL